MISRRFPWLGYFPERGDVRGVLVHYLVIIPVYSAYFVALLVASSAVVFGGRQGSLAGGLLLFDWAVATCLFWVKATVDMVRRGKALVQGATPYVRVRFRVRGLMLDGQRGHALIPWNEVGDVESTGAEVTILNAAGIAMAQAERVSYPGSSISLSCALATSITVERDVRSLREATAHERRALVGVYARFHRACGIVWRGADVEVLRPMKGRL